MIRFIKTVLRLCIKIAGMFLENRSDTVHKYGHVVQKALSASCTLKKKAITCLYKTLKSLYKSYLKRLTTMTFAEVGVCFSLHHDFVLSSGLKRLRFHATLGEPKTYFRKNSRNC